MVLLIRHWLKAEPGVSVEEIQHKFREIGTHLSVATTRNYRESAHPSESRSSLWTRCGAHVSYTKTPVNAQT
jgi:hypothetical protein